MKTLAQILADARQIFGQPDASNSNFTDAQLKIWANEGYRRLVVAFGQLPIKTRDYTPSSQTVTLSTATFKVNRARHKAQPADEFVDLEIVDLDELIRRDPDWENAATGIPELFVRTGTFAAVLYPGPNAANLGQTLRCTGVEFPTELSDDTDTPDLPEAAHDLIPNWVAHKALQYLERGEDSVAQLTLFRGGLRDQRNVSQDFSNQLKRFRFAEVDD